MEVFCDDGFSFARMEGGSVPSWIQNSYSYGEFNLTISDVATNTPTGTPCRGPSSTQCHAFSETLMEHVATQLGVDPLDLRMANLLQPGDQVYTFNENNDTYEYEGPNPIPEMINL